MIGFYPSNGISKLFEFSYWRLMCLDRREAAALIIEQILNQAPNPRVVMHINVHSLRALSGVPGLLSTCHPCTWPLLEGIGLKTACLLTKGWIPADTNGTDLVPLVLDQLRNIPCRLFLLGGGAESVALSASRIETEWPWVKVVGFRDGYFLDKEFPAVQEQVAQVSPTMLLIGMGSPRQEALAFKFIDVRGLNVIWTVGGLFDFLSGRIRRAPRLLRALGLEWLFRILLEPRRLFPRYISDAAWLAKFCLYESRKLGLRR